MTPTFVRRPCGNIAPANQAAMQLAQRFEHIESHVRLTAPQARNRGRATANTLRDLALEQSVFSQVFDHSFHSIEYIPIPDLEYHEMALIMQDLNCRIESMKPEQIADRIRLRMEAARLQQNGLAAAAGIAPATLNRIINGNFKRTPLVPLQAIAAALGCSLIELIGDEAPVAHVLSSNAQKLSLAIAMLDQQAHLSDALTAGLLAIIENAKHTAVPAPRHASDPANAPRTADGKINMDNPPGVLDALDALAVKGKKAG